MSAVFPRLVGCMEWHYNLIIYEMLLCGKVGLIGLYVTNGLFDNHGIMLAKQQSMSV